MDWINALTQDVNFIFSVWVFIQDRNKVNESNRK